MGRTDRIIAVVQGNGDRLVTDRPLRERLLTQDLRPQLMPLCESELAAQRHLPIDHVE